MLVNVCECSTPSTLSLISRARRCTASASSYLPRRWINQPILDTISARFNSSLSSFAAWLVASTA
jgi:hypothetical protein